MPRLTKIYTRTGDEGLTSLGVKRRVSKDDPRVVAYGEVDEFNSLLGVVLASGPVEDLVEILGTIQNDLFHLGSELCMPAEERGEIEIPTLEQRHIEQLERWIDQWLDQLPALENFVLPGGGEVGARREDRRVCAALPEPALGSALRDGSLGEQSARQGRDHLG